MPSSILGRVPFEDELLAIARAGNLDALGDERKALADAVRRFAEIGDGASARELVALSWRVWQMHGEAEEGSAAAEAALDAPGADEPSADRARVLYADGLFAFRLGDDDRSRARNEEALAAAREVGDTRAECEALTGLARVALREGDYARAVELAREGRAEAQAAGDRSAEAPPLHLEAAALHLAGDYAHARELYEQSLALNEELGDTSWVAMELHNLGWVEIHLGSSDAAAERFRARDARESGQDAYGRAWHDLNWAAVAVLRGDRDEARARLAAGEQALETLGLTPDPDDQLALDWLRAQLAS
jgi:tetratricopeptide (TPR) repeat protein